MPKAKKTDTTTKTTKPKSTVTNGAHSPAPHEFFPMPASAEGWRQCERITRIAFSVLESGPHLLSDSLLQFADSFSDVGIALKKMSLLCSGAHARIIAASIRSGQRGVKVKPAAKPRKAA